MERLIGEEGKENNGKGDTAAGKLRQSQREEKTVNGRSK